jgi:hypothetical protein
VEDPGSIPGLARFIVATLHLIHAMLRRETKQTSDIHAHNLVTRGQGCGCDWLSHLKPVLGMGRIRLSVGEPVSPFCNVGVTVTLLNIILRIAGKLSHLSITLEMDNVLHIFMDCRLEKANLPFRHLVHVHIHDDAI